jgi:NADPH:quinone reductase-like Zn-dependent oxidoreductase
LNRLDLAVRGGLPNVKVPFPHVLGSDVAGQVSHVGPGVDPAWQGRAVVLNPGVSCGTCEACLGGRDNLCRSYRILGENTRGGYAEAVVVPAANLLPRPAGLDAVRAAAIPLVFLTAWQMLVERARIVPGESVLIHAVGSGVGSAALQIAKLFGAQVVALASSEAKLETARRRGADACVSTADEAWPERVRAVPFVGKRGVDVVVEHVGRSTWDASLKLACRGGRIVTCGATSGWDATTDLRHVFFRQLQILGSTMGSKSVLHRVLALVEQGKLAPEVDRTFPLAEAEAAHRYLDRREQYGKVVLTISP